MKPKHVWHDDWIIENYTKFQNWTECRKAYNEEFGTDICRDTFKWYAGQKLGLRLDKYNYGKEQDDFLREYYPILDGPELERMYNMLFSPSKTYNKIRQRANSLGLTKSAEFMSSMQSTHALKRKNIAPIGHMVVGEGGLRIKIARGEYKMLSRVVYEKHHGVKLKPDEYVLYLDGDNSNVSIDNLAVVTKAELVQINHTLKLPRTNRNVEVTKAAIAWSRLYIANRDNHA